MDASPRDLGLVPSTRRVEESGYVPEEFTQSGNRSTLATAAQKSVRVETDDSDENDLPEQAPERLSRSRSRITRDTASKKYITVYEDTSDGSENSDASFESLRRVAQKQISQKRSDGFDASAFKFRRMAKAQASIRSTSEDDDSTAEDYHFGGPVRSANEQNDSDLQPVTTLRSDGSRSRHAAKRQASARGPSFLDDSMTNRNKLPWVYRIWNRFAASLSASGARNNYIESSGSTGNQSSAPGDGNDEYQRPDLERGDAERPSSSGPTLDNGPDFIIEPTISSFDVDLKGRILKFRTYSSSDTLKEKEPTQDVKTVRIILKEKGEVSLVDVSKAFMELEGSDEVVQKKEEIFGKGMRHALGYGLKTWLRKSQEPLSDRIRPLAELSVSLLEKCIWSGKMRRRFDIQSLIKLCGGCSRFQNNGLVLQANLQQSAFPPSTLTPSPMQFKFPLISSPSRIHNAYYSMSTRFWRMFAEVEFSLGRRTQVTCFFPAPIIRSRDFSTAKKKKQGIISPLQRNFEDILCSNVSSLRFSNGDKANTCRLVLLDLMRATMSLWADFFIGFGHLKDVPKPDGSQSLQDLEKDTMEHEDNLAAIRDMTSCIKFLIQSIEINRPAKMLANDEHLRCKWDVLKAELDASITAVKDKATDLLGRSNRNVEFYVANANERQANSARSLTLVASVFLPMTLAASLLTVTVPVAAIGRLWYDWIGLCLTIGFIVTMSLLFFHAVKKAARRRPWNHILITISALRHHFWTVPIIAGLLFGNLVMASFLAGMFHSIETAVDVLKYGIPGLIALGLLWYLFLLLFLMIRCIYKYVHAFNEYRRNAHRLGGKGLHIFTLLSPENEGQILEEELFKLKYRALKALAMTKSLQKIITAHQSFCYENMVDGPPEKVEKHLQRIRTIIDKDVEVKAMFQQWEILRSMIELRTQGG